MGNYGKKRFCTEKRLNLIMKKIYYIIALLSLLGFGQKKKDLDSLLQETLKSYRAKDYTNVFKNGHYAIKKSPTYLDYHLLLGNSHLQLKQKDSAIYYLSYITERNTKYKDAFISLVNAYLNVPDYQKANDVNEQSLALFPDEKYFLYKKIDILTGQGKEKELENYLKEQIQKYPDDVVFTNQLNEIFTANNMDRIGVHYGGTFIGRDGAGPWHIYSLSYSRARRNFSIIGRFNQQQRFSNGELSQDGQQFEIESYKRITRKSYVMINYGHSDDRVFIKNRYLLSYYYNFKGGWETEVGFRHNDSRDDANTTTYVAALGKYYGSFFTVLRTSHQTQESKYYFSTSLATRYYFLDRFNYLALGIGYGTDPEDRINNAFFRERARLDSYRVSLGYNKSFSERWFTSFGVGYNKQEYVKDKIQDEYSLSVSLSYKL
jgi:YaiO family outer membrane protein